MAQRSESFARLLKAGIGSITNCEGKTAPVIEDELGQQIGRAHTAIQRYKSGYLPPEAGIVQALAEACVSGKTSLAREVAARSLQADSVSARFDAVVCVSDKDRPGTTNLSVLLDELARTLDYPGFTQLDHAEKQREIENLLRRQRVLVAAPSPPRAGCSAKAPRCPPASPSPSPPPL